MWTCLDNADINNVDLNNIQVELSNNELHFQLMETGVSLGNGQNVRLLVGEADSPEYEVVTTPLQSTGVRSVRGSTPRLSTVTLNVVKVRYYLSYIVRLDNYQKKIGANFNLAVLTK